MKFQMLGSVKVKKNAGIIRDICMMNSENFIDRETFMSDEMEIRLLDAIFSHSKRQRAGRRSESTLTFEFLGRVECK